MSYLKPLEKLYAYSCKECAERVHEKSEAVEIPSKCPFCRCEEEPEESGYRGYYGPDWRNVRTRVLERDGYVCQGCGMSNEEHLESDLIGGGLHIHHKKKFTRFDTYEAANRLDNLISLCAKCHRKAENGSL